MRLGVVLLLGVLAATGQVNLGPAIGSRVPDFEAVDQNGQTWSLQKLTGPKGLMLVFYRSADW
jgi:AhpC/TSA family